MTAKYHLKLQTDNSTSTQSGTLRSPGHYTVLVSVLHGALSDDFELLGAAPAMLELLRNLTQHVEALDGTSVANEMLVDTHRALIRTLRHIKDPIE